MKVQRGPATMSDPFLGEGEPLKKKIQMLLFFRLVVAVSFLSLTLFVQIYRNVDLLSSKLLPLYVFSCILFVFTIIAGLTIRKARRFSRHAYGQLCFDVCAVTVLIYLSGGVNSLFSFLYMPVIISASLLLYRRGGLLMAAASSLAYGVLLDLEYFQWLTPLHVLVDEPRGADIATYFHTLIMNIVVFFLVAFLSGYLAEEWLKSSEEVRRQKKDLQSLTSLHHNIVESINSGLLTINSGGMVVFSNAAARDILRVEREELDGKFIGQIMSDVDHREWDLARDVTDPEESSRALARKHAVFQRSTGESLSLGYTVTHLQDTEGGRRGWVFIFQDLTEVKKMEKHVQRLERLALAGRIAAEISHEIKNPLAAMSGAVQMILAGSELEPTHRRLVGIVHREIDRINALITDFLWLARGGQKQGKVESLSVCAAILEIVDVLRMREKLGAKHSVQTRFACRPQLMLDAGQFRQVMWNVLLNAVEAMPEGGEVVVNVDCGIAPSEQADGKSRQEVCIEVIDSGPGISEDMKEKVFEPFFSTKTTGTGLGLGITYQIMESLGGRIHMASREPAGTSFSLFFPL